MYFYSEIIIFVENDIDSILIFWEIFDYLKIYFLNIKVIPIKDRIEILKFCSKCDNNCSHRLFLVIEEKKINTREKVTPGWKFSENISKNESKIHGYEYKIYFYHFSFLDSLNHVKLNQHKNFLSLKSIDVLNYFKNYKRSPLRSGRKLTFPDNLITSYENIIWVKSVITCHLYLSNTLSFYECTFRLKKISFLFAAVLKKKELVEKNKSITLNFSKELPFHFLYHSVLIDSVLNTPSILINFETWKKEGFFKILKFLGEIYVSKEDAHSLWIDLEDKKRFLIMRQFEIEIKNTGSIFNSIYIFKKRFQNLSNSIQMSSFDTALALRSIFDLKIRDLDRKVKKKNFWLCLKSLFGYKEIKKFIEKEKNVLKFITRVSRKVLSRKTFISQQAMRLLYISGSSRVTFKMIEGLLKLLNSVFIRNKIKKKLLLIIIKEKNSVTLFISHQEKNLVLFYTNFLATTLSTDIYKIVKKEKEMVILKFSRIYEKEIISTLSGVYLV
jgi:hypothetical protein